jgi:hypothetical protein
MKNILLVFIMLVFAVTLQAQERTVNSSQTTMETGRTYIEYNAIAADTLVTVNQDTIDYVFNNYNHGATEKISIALQLDSIAGNDSIYYALTGYNYIGGTGTSIASSGILVNELNDFFEISDYVASVTDDTSFRHYVLRLIQDDNALYDGGASLDFIYFKIHLK